MHRESVLMDGVEKGQVEIRNGDPCKVALTLGRDETTYLLDRTLLRLTSAEFDKLLSTDETCYQIKDVEPNVFQEIARHIYMCLEWKFNGELVETCDLIRAAGNYGLTDLCRIVLDHISTLPFDGLVRNSNASYAFDVVRNLEYDGGVFAKKISSYICKNAKAIFAANYFLDLSCGALVEILGEDNLEIDCELDIFKAVLRWGEHNILKISNFLSLQALREMLEVPLRHIRFRNMTSFQLQNYVLPLGILNLELQRLIDEELKSAENQLGNVEILIIDGVGSPSNEASMLKMRKYFSVPSEIEQCREASMDEILRAELFVSKFKFQTIVGSLREEISLTKVAFKQEFDETQAKLQEEIRKQKEVTTMTEIAFKDFLQANASFQEETRKYMEANLAFQTKLKQEMVALQENTRRVCSKTREKPHHHHHVPKLGPKVEAVYAPPPPAVQLKQEITQLQTDTSLDVLTTPRTDDVLLSTSWEDFVARSNFAVDDYESRNGVSNSDLFVFMKNDTDVKLFVPDDMLLKNEIQDIRPYSEEDFSFRKTSSVKQEFFEHKFEDKTLLAAVDWSPGVDQFAFVVYQGEGILIPDGSIFSTTWTGISRVLKPKKAGETFIRRIGERHFLRGSLMNRIFRIHIFEH